MLGNKFITMFFVAALLLLAASTYFWRNEYLLEFAAHQQTRQQCELLLVDQSRSNSTIKALTQQLSDKSRLLARERSNALSRAAIMRQSGTQPANSTEVINNATSKNVITHINNNLGSFAQRHALLPVESQRMLPAANKHQTIQ